MDAALGGARFAEALRMQPLPDDAAALIDRPRDVHRFSLPVRMDSGGLRVFTGWRVRYSDALGPTKGGVRFHPATSEQDLIALAFRLLLKCAVNGLPHGGAGGGVAVDHHQLSTGEREQLARLYVDALGDRVGPDHDILSPDLGTDAETMRWMADQYNRTHGTAVAAAINGKPVSIGGIPGREGATARGAWTVLREVLHSSGLKIDGLTCAIQGYGSAGGRLAMLLQEQNIRLVAVSDTSAGWHNPRGLDASALWEARQGRRFAEIDVPGASRIAPHEVLTVPADVVIPAATANQITSDIAALLRCRIILEIANGPVAVDAEAIIASKGILVIPDLVANAGGITMSHFEWVQNRSGLLWTEDEARLRLDARMTATARSTIHTSQQRHVSLAVAAQLGAVERLASALG